MRIFLAGVAGFLGNYLKDVDLAKDPIYMLESFYYEDDEKAKSIAKAKDFLLDSGAFTFMQSSKKAVDWEEYLDRYIAFVNKWDVKNFFELDIDTITGYDYVKKLRVRLEKETGKQCMPVFHKIRGLAEWERMCQEYPYVAIGTMHEYNGRPDILVYLLDIAKKYGTKVHGLGFTRLNLLAKVPFYSVDSTSWCCGNRFGFVDKFNGETIEKIPKPVNCRLKSAELCIQHSFREWVKFQKYMDLKYR